MKCNFDCFNCPYPDCINDNPDLIDTDEYILTDKQLEYREYCTQKENCNRGTRNRRLSDMKKKLHLQQEIKRDELGRFVS